MDKHLLIQEIQLHLKEELKILEAAAKASLDAATNDESKAEDQYDTRGLEASYLAKAQAERVADIQRQLIMYRFLPVRNYGSSDVIAPGVLTQLKLNGKDAFYFLVPQGGGLITQIAGIPVQVITPQSPVGQALLGRKAGDTIEVESRGTVREYLVVSIS